MTASASQAPTSRDKGIPLRSGTDGLRPFPLHAEAFHQRALRG